MAAPGRSPVSLVDVTIGDLLAAACDPAMAELATGAEHALPRYVEGDTPWRQAPVAS